MKNTRNFTVILLSFLSLFLDGCRHVSFADVNEVTRLTGPIAEVFVPDVDWEAEISPAVEPLNNINILVRRASDRIVFVTLSVQSERNVVLLVPRHQARLSKIDKDYNVLLLSSSLMSYIDINMLEMFSVCGEVSGSFGVAVDHEVDDLIGKEFDLVLALKQKERGLGKGGLYLAENHRVRVSLVE